jgi:DHA2 family metal-tetracycline-proton antiporter-like MFS transporter
MAYFFLPKATTSMKYKGFDFVGSILILLAVTALILPLEMGGRMGWTSPLIILGFVFSLILIISFYLWEARYANPLFNVCLLKHKYLNLSIASGFMSSFVLTGTVFLLPFYLELIMNYSTDIAGLVILIPTLLIVVVAPLSGRISDDRGSKVPSVIGAICLAIALFVLTILNPTIGKYGVVFVFLALLMRSLSDGMFAPANNKLVMSHSPKGMLGTVSSLLNTAKYLGLVMGVVIFETIFDSTVSHSAAVVEGVATTGAFQFSVPIETLLTGFQGAFLLGALISILIILTTLFSKENLNNNEIKKINYELDDIVNDSPVDNADIWKKM